MPRKNREHAARLEIRLPKAMLYALRWTADHDRLPLSDWVRNKLNEHCLSVSVRGGEERLRESRSMRHQVMASRPLQPDTDEWRGGREEQPRVRLYKTLDGGSTNAPDDHDRMIQDVILDRAEARRELRTWINRWGREGKTNRLTPEQSRLASRLLATFDRDP